MLIRTFSATLQGLKVLPIEIEADSTQGKPNLIIIGLAEKTLEEARERITAALCSCNIRLKCKKTLVNLAPADVKKTGSNLELGIAVALLELTAVKKFSQPTDIFFGELALNGELRAIRGALPLVIFAKEHGFKRIFLPAVNQKEVNLLTGVEIYPLTHLQELINFFTKKENLTRLKPQAYTPPLTVNQTDFSEIIGQKMAKRCLEIAAAGGHNLLLCGVPGSGKSLLAAALPSILPPLTEKEALELTEIYSIAGLTSANDGLITTRPCRTPHHTISTIGLTGGGLNLLPGEISLAHHGVLFLDELAEFRRDTLEALRQPLENRSITISRAHGCVAYPADISLIAATNPCPCGFLGSQKQRCHCTQQEILRYRHKLSGPILDRLDMQIFVPEVDLPQLTKQKSSLPEETSTQVRARVIRARQIQTERWQKLGLTLNAQLSSAQVRTYIKLDPEAITLLQQAAQKWQLSARGYFKLIKVAQTIADLETAATTKDSTLSVKHLAQSIQYRQWQT